MRGGEGEKRLLICKMLKVKGDKSTGREVLLEVLFWKYFSMKVLLRLVLERREVMLVLVMLG